MSTSEEVIEIRLSKSEALILFDWLARFNEGRIPETDAVEKQVLCNLEATFESLLVEPFANNYLELLALAKARNRQA